MYAVHLAIVIVYVAFFLSAAGLKLPAVLRRDEAYLHPFYRIAMRLMGILPKRTASGGEEVKKELMMLHPAADGNSLLRSFRIRRTGKALMLLFGGNLIALLMCISSDLNSPLAGENYVERNDYGGGKKSVTLDVYADGELALKGEDIEIGERHYTQEETEEIFAGITERLEAEILGDNESLDHVSSDLRLVNAVEGYPVSIEWQLKDYGIMDSEGHLKAEGIDPGGSLQQLTAVLSYYGVYEEHSFSAMLYPPEQEKDFSQRLKDEMELWEEETKSRPESVLPSELEGHRITYRPHKSSDSLLILFLIAGLSAFSLKLSEGELKKELRKRDTQMMIDYPQIVSKLTLLLGAGMTIQGAFGKLAADYEKSRREGEERFAYEEMLLTVRQMGSGVSEQEAYVGFGNRCALQKYVKLGATLSQNLKRGGGTLLEILESEEKDAFEERKALARRLGEEAGTKLLAPMGIMLVIVMVIVVVPAFLSFSL